jgi:hypothetical protein
MSFLCNLVAHFWYNYITPLKYQVLFLIVNEVSLQGSSNRSGSLANLVFVLAAWSPAFHCHERKEKPPLYLL